MFEMFERERWSEEGIHAHLTARAKAAALAEAPRDSL